MIINYITPIMVRHFFPLSYKHFIQTLQWVHHDKSKLEYEHYLDVFEINMRNISLINQQHHQILYKKKRRNKQEIGWNITKKYKIDTHTKGSLLFMTWKRKREWQFLFDKRFRWESSGFPFFFWWGYILYLFWKRISYIQMWLYRSIAYQQLSI